MALRGYIIPDCDVESLQEIIGPTVPLRQLTLKRLRGMARSTAGRVGSQVSGAVGKARASASRTAGRLADTTPRQALHQVKRGARLRALAALGPRGRALAGQAGQKIAAAGKGLHTRGAVAMQRAGTFGRKHKRALQLTGAGVGAAGLAAGGFAAGRRKRKR